MRVLFGRGIAIASAFLFFQHGFAQDQVTSPASSSTNVIRPPKKVPELPNLSIPKTEPTPVAPATETKSESMVIVDPRLVERSWSWQDNVEFSADMRYRHDYTNSQAGKSRNQHLIRARFGVGARINSGASLGFGIASGNDSPTTTAQGFDGGFSSKPIRLDLAFIQLAPPSAHGAKFLLGKMKSPFVSVNHNELLFDRDVRPEGIAIKYHRPAGPVSVLMNLGLFWAEEEASAPDTFLVGAQTGVRAGNLGHGISLVGGGGFYAFTNLAGRPALAGVPGGNSVDANGNYLNDYRNWEAFGQVQAAVQNMAVGYFLNYSENFTLSAGHRAWIMGVFLGGLEKPGDFKIDYNVRRIDRDAAVGAYASSMALGGTVDTKGHYFGGHYKFTRNFKGGISYSHFSDGVDADMNGHRVLLDFSVSL